MVKKQDKNSKERPPVVAVMGHIDHGKTTLLDYIRKTNVADKEKGGITQSIGAYEIEHKDKKITFIDTPGHEAFSKMRSHGAKVADLAILVVAADDGVKPQTTDAFSHIQKAGIPYVVAMNKMDLPGADAEKTKQSLAKIGVYLEGFGGSISYHPISAKEGDGVEELLDLVILAAEVESLEYDPQASASGVVLTSLRSPKRGVMAGVVIKDGKLKLGDDVYTESAKGKVKFLENFLGEPAKELDPSSPALVLGFSEPPKIGEIFRVGSSPERTDNKAETKEKVSKDEKCINVVLKASETGSLEALEDLITKLSISRPFHVVESSVGNIGENDANRAFSSNAIIVGFGTKLDKVAENIAKSQKIKIITSPIIYDLEKDLQEFIEQIVSTEKRAIEVLATFGRQEEKQVVGGKVIAGYAEKNEAFEVFFGDKKVGVGKIVNLQSKKKDVSRAEEGQEVGLLVEAGVKIKEGSHLILK